MQLICYMPAIRVSYSSFRRAESGIHPAPFRPNRRHSCPPGPTSHPPSHPLPTPFPPKEAFPKSFGTGFKRAVLMKDIGVVNAPSGAPTLQLTGGARARLDAMAPPGHAIEVHLTMTDDHPWAQAFVILYARKMEP